jgi:hypothetical protein
MIKIRTAYVTESPKWGTRKDGSHVLNSGCTVLITADYRGHFSELIVRLDEGFRCDGLSVPWAFRWFLPSWDSKNALYNLAGAVHDWLYTTKGNDGMFSREECDDIFRGIMRESGIGRFKAGCADKAVEWFAGGGKHWGNDSYGIKHLGHVTVRVG